MEITPVYPGDMHASPGQVRPAGGWRWSILAAALLLGLTGRIAYSYSAPLWFDETYSGVIASQASFAGLIKWCLAELTGPAYYIPLWAWEKVAGHSDMALRLPSLIISLLTPLAILRFGYEDRDLAFWWAVIVLLWVPILPMAGEARAYPQIFALGVAQAAIFVRLIGRPSLRLASIWIAVSSLQVLTNYWGAIPALVQGLAFLLVHRARAVRLWPAGLLLAPLLGWSWFHLPFVLGLTIGGSSGLAGLPLADILKVPAILMGVTMSATVILAVVAASLLAAWAGSGYHLGRPLRPEWVLSICAVASVAAVLTIAFIRPGFAPRYAMASMPSFLFGLALWVRWMLLHDRRLVVVVITMLFATAVGIVLPVVRGPDKDPRHVFEVERPSAWLMASPKRAPNHLVVFWDGPIAQAVPEFTLREVAGFFLRRSGHEVQVSVVRLPLSGDPNPGVLALAEKNVAAILWFANDALPAARKPRIGVIDSRFECRDFGSGEVTMTACRQPNLSAAASSSL